MWLLKAVTALPICLPQCWIRLILNLSSIWMYKTCSMEQAKLGAQQWKSAQESLLHLERSNVASVDELVRLVINYRILF